MIKTFKTAVFNVKFSKRKGNIIDTQMRLAENAFYDVIERLAHHVEPLIKLNKEQRKDMLTRLKKEASQLIKPHPLSNASKSGVVADAIAQISSTVELRLTGQDAKLPTRNNRDIDTYDIGMDMLVGSLDLESQDLAKQLIYSKPYDGMPRPLLWLRTRPSDGAMLLRDGLGRYFVYINSHSSKSKFSKAKVVINDLVNVRTGETENFSSSTGLLLPIQLSKWHQSEFLAKGKPKSYRLIKKADGYILAVTFEFKAEKIEPATYLGVDRGIDKIAAFAVTSKKEVLKKDFCDGNELRDYQKECETNARKKQTKGNAKYIRWRGYTDLIMHKIANEIVNTALKYRSQVVLEDLTNIANGHHHRRARFARKTNFNKVLSRQQYQKLQHLLNYKLSYVGLPTPLFVRAAGTSITCNRCGNYDSKNRDLNERSLFLCKSCNYQDNADVNAAVTISMKGEWLTTQFDKEHKKMKNRFSDWIPLPS
ncbi:zinc ribbon domain-containing protein [Saccharobesus litoralis]|nr:zinc ribbon domain-containing protein [Saccharobesus litoralis]